MSINGSLKSHKKKIINICYLIRAYEKHERENKLAQGCERRGGGQETNGIN